MFIAAATIRDADHHIPQLRSMIAAWPVQPAEIILLVDGEGQDDTNLQAWLDYDLANEDRVFVFTGDKRRPPRYSREATMARAQHFADIRNQLVDVILDHSDAEHVLFFDAGKRLSGAGLAALLAAGGCPVVAPMSVLDEPTHALHGHFYDTWCYRWLDGTPFLNYAPRQMERMEGQAVASVGGVVLVQRAVIEAGARFGSGSAQDCDWVGLCRSARELGFSVTMLGYDPEINVRARHD